MLAIEYVLFFVCADCTDIICNCLNLSQKNSGCDNAETYMKFHALLHRGQALNAYEARMHLDDGTLNFGHGLDFEGGKTQKREKRPPTQIEIMAEMEREKQAKKEERRQAREAKKQARIEQEEFIRNGGTIKLSKKDKKRLEADME